MCDTILAMPTNTAERITLFGKNSDRQRNEAQGIEVIPAIEHGLNAEIKCTYITIPQVARTHAVLLCRPFWIWGAEMGVNEHGVVIGNEGVRARREPGERNALLGMDLIRLALERATTAHEAVSVITDLLNQHGQGGNCSFLTPTYYDNSFMIADRREAFVLETVGCEWVAERVRGVRAISNDYSIERPDFVSSGMAALLKFFGSSAEPENYSAAIADPSTQHIGRACERRTRATDLLKREEKLSVADMMRILRDHGSDHSHINWSPRAEGAYGLCIHARDNIGGGQTTGSLVAEIYSERPLCWVTGTSAPCTSIFKPVMLDLPLPIQGPFPDDRCNGKTLWWQHEALHRKALKHDFAAFLSKIADERDQLEADFQERMISIAGADPVARATEVELCWQIAAEAEARWEAILPKELSSSTGSRYDAAWIEMDRIAGLG